MCYPIHMYYLRDDATYEALSTAAWFNWHHLYHIYISNIGHHHLYGSFRIDGDTNLVSISEYIMLETFVVFDCS